MNGMPSGISPVQLGRAQSVTSGLDFRQGRFALLAEGGASHRDDGLQYEQESAAAALDGSWRASDSMTLPAIATSGAITRRYRGLRRPV
jgi:hypothetical protein